MNKTQKGFVLIEVLMIAIIFMNRDFLELLDGGIDTWWLKLAVVIGIGASVGIYLFSDKEDTNELQNAEFEESGSHSIRECSFCNTKLRLPKGKSGSVKCPHCGEKFHTST